MFYVILNNKIDSVYKKEEDAFYRFMDLMIKNQSELCREEIDVNYCRYYNMITGETTEIKLERR